MKRLIIIFALSIFALAAFGQSSDRDVLLTTDGTLYSVESVFATADEAVKIRSNRYLVLSVESGKETHTQIIPASANGGSHLEPSLAYDSDTKTLFVFWEAARTGALATDLAFTWYRDGVWGQVTTLDRADWDSRVNLRIAVTRKTETTAKDGSKTTIPEITIHAVWWELGNTSEWARYAMITVDHGDVTVDSVQNLTNFVSQADPFLDSESNREILRHPGIFESPNQDSVDVVFGDPRTDKMHRVTIHPVTVEGGKIRVPIGKSRGIPTPTASIASTDVSAISTGDDNIAYVFSSGDAMKYLLFKNGQWSDVRSLNVNSRFTADAAMNALRKMLSSQ
jgi:hypothetical protein